MSTTAHRPDLQFTPTSSRIVACRWDAGLERKTVHPSEHETRSGQITQTPQEPAMTKTLVRTAAFALAALTTLGTVAAANGIATKQYSAATRAAEAADGTTHLALQRVVVVARRVKA
jgi:hypothetical protein